jgi:hypothetical protein
MRPVLLVPVFLAATAACSRASESTPAPAQAASTAASSVATPSAGTLLLGERVTAPVLPLTDIAHDPAHYANRVVATTGKVTAVCQEMGCWMEIQDASGQAHVRMHGHKFFVPKTAAGHMARVQATVVKSGGGEDDCEEQPGNDKATAKIELDATGIELD